MSYTLVAKHFSRFITLVALAAVIGKVAASQQTTGGGFTANDSREFKLLMHGAALMDTPSSSHRRQLRSLHTHTHISANAEIGYQQAKELDLQMAPDSLIDIRIKDSGADGRPASEEDYQTRPSALEMLSDITIAGDGAVRPVHKKRSIKQMRRTHKLAHTKCVKSGVPDAPFKVLKHCSDDNGVKYGWPMFTSTHELRNSRWADYFLAVYGELPNATSDSPVCTFTLSHLYKPLLDKAQLSATLPDIATDCNRTIGQRYAVLAPALQKAYSEWIWNPNLAQPLASGSLGLPSDYWVEILHHKRGDDSKATWMYYAPGSAIWFHLRKTKVYNDHNDAVGDLLKEDCAFFYKPKECDAQFPRMYTAALAIGLNSLQFLKHSDMNCGNSAIEIVGFDGSGVYGCGMTFADGSTCGISYLRAGWEAKHECICDNADTAINCKGFGINSTFDFDQEANAKTSIGENSIYAQPRAQVNPAASFEEGATVEASLSLDKQSVGHDHRQHIED